MVVKLLPTINDILFGRGHSISNHEGNRRLRHIIDKYEEEYHLIAKTRATKIQTMHKILREIGENGARFLRYDYSTKAWYEVDRKTVVEKVGHALRDRKAQLLESVEEERILDLAKRGKVETRLHTQGDVSTFPHSDSNRAMGPTHIPVSPASGVRNLERDLLEQYARVAVAKYIADPLPVARARPTPQGVPRLLRTSHGGDFPPQGTEKMPLSRAFNGVGVDMVRVDDLIRNTHQQQQRQERSIALGGQQYLELRGKMWADLGLEVALDHGHAMLRTGTDRMEFKDWQKETRSTTRNVHSGTTDSLRLLALELSRAVALGRNVLLRNSNDSDHNSSFARRSNLATQMSVAPEHAVCSDGGYSDGGYDIYCIGP